MRDLRLIGGLDHNFGWQDGRLSEAAPDDAAVPVSHELLGAVAWAHRSPVGRWRLLRDPLGLNKLFWSSADDTILVAARPHRLVEAGCAFETIRALPPGVVVDLDLDRGCARVSRLRLGAGTPAPEPALGDDAVSTLATRIRARLDAFVAALARSHARARVLVCLSGGLDSTGIAVLARDHFTDVTAVSFDLRRANGHVSADRRVAEALAPQLGLPLLRVTVSEEELFAALDTVLLEGVDWRDFNVHAALVNASLARASAAASTPDAAEPPLVLTGDLANEFLIDYHTETYRGQSYYRVPRLQPAALRTMLVRGLETSHREVGPFEASGLPVVQPYAAAADLFLALPPEFLAAPDRKTRLTRAIFGDRIPPFVYERRKTRAQIGDDDPGAGVLGLCADRGVDERCLRRRFAELHRVRDMRALDRFIRAGRYYSAIPLPEESA
jgi:asparagine synthetase B (glutamine-hydrolysing)